MTRFEQTNIESAIARIELLRKGTRRLHLSTGQVWRVVSGTGRDNLIIVRELDGERRTVAAGYWLGDSWGRPKNRAGCRS